MTSTHSPEYTHSVAATAAAAAAAAAAAEAEPQSQPQQEAESQPQEETKPTAATSTDAEVQPTVQPTVQPESADQDTTNQQQQSTDDTKDTAKQQQTKPSADATHRVVSTSYFSTTINKPGQPAVYFSRTENTDENGVVLGTEERRIGDKKAFSTWKVTSDADTEAAVQNSYENADAGDFETTWAGLNGAPPALTYSAATQNHGTPVAKFGDHAPDNEAKDELPVLGSAPSSPSVPAAKPETANTVEHKTASITTETKAAESKDQESTSAPPNQTKHTDDETKTKQQNQVDEQKKTDNDDDDSQTPYVYYFVRQPQRRVVKRPPSLLDAFFGFSGDTGYTGHPLRRRADCEHGYCRRQVSPYYFDNVPVGYHSRPLHQYSPLASSYRSPVYYRRPRPLFFW